MYWEQTYLKPHRGLQLFNTALFQCCCLLRTNYIKDMSKNEKSNKKSIIMDNVHFTMAYSQPHHIPALLGYSVFNTALFACCCVFWQTYPQNDQDLWL